jgi:uncharacterized protein with LGFP repeats
MIIKALEIRDDGTCIGVLAMRMSPENDAQRAVLSHAGYGKDGFTQSKYVAMIDAHTLCGSYDPFKQESRTRAVAHEYIREHFDELSDGDVIDVEYIEGKRATPKTSEIQAYYGFGREG